MLAVQSDPDLTDACGRDPSWICRRAFEWTDSKAIAELSDLIFGSFGRIVVVVVVAFLVNLAVRRAIKRFTTSMAESAAGDTLKSLRRRAPAVVSDSAVFSSRAAARATTLGNVLRSASSFVIWSIAGITVLGELGVNLGPIVASAGIAGVALGFGAQSLVKDVISGMFMLLEDQYGVGDIVDLGQATGTVEAVSLRATRLRDTSGTVWFVPNGIVQRVGNMSQQWARALLDVSVAYGTDVDRAEEVIKETADALRNDPEWAGTILEPAEVWGIEQLGPESIEIRLVVKTRPSEQFKVSRELRRRLLKAFEAEGIEVPNGRRTVLLREDPPDGN